MTRLSFRSCTFLIMLAASGLAVPSAAQSVAVTSGFLDMQGSSGSLLLGGDRGFTLDSRVAAASGVFGPGFCNSTPSTCVPGATVDLTALWTGGDVLGSATLDARLYGGLGSASSTNQATIHFTGGATLPAASGAPRTIAAPFTFSGTFDHLDATGAPTREVLAGTGTATLTLAPSVVVPGAWSIARVFYALDGQLPVGWTTADVGVVGTPGRSTATPTQITVSGAGADVWGTADGFRFAFQPVGSDSTMTTRVDALTASQPYAKAGLMVRAGLGSAAAHAILDIKPNGEVEFMTRAGDGQSMRYLGGGYVGYPAWLKLQRQNDLVTAFVSSNGTQWTLLGTTVVAGLRFGGLAVTSHDLSTTSDATFSATAVAQNTAASASSSWLRGDIGAVGLAGSSIEQQDSVTVQAAGGDIWGTADGFHFVYQPLRGSGVVARVASLQQTHVFAKAGVMIRNSVAADAAHVVLDVRPSGEIEFMARTADGGETTYYTGSWMVFPGWLKLLRQGNTFTGYASSDGTTWSVVGVITVPLGPDTLAGIVVTSHDTTRVTAATFDHVALLP